MFRVLRLSSCRHLGLHHLLVSESNVPIIGLITRQDLVLEKAELTLCGKVAEDLLQGPQSGQQPLEATTTTTEPPGPLGASKDSLPPLPRGNPPPMPLQPALSLEPVAPLQSSHHHSQFMLTTEGSPALPKVDSEPLGAASHGTTAPAGALSALQSSSALQSCLVSSLGPALLGSLTTEGTVSGIGTLSQHIASALPGGISIPPPSSVEVIVGPSSTAAPGEGPMTTSPGHPEDAVIAMVHQTCLEPVQEAES